jgi:exodeoxyribonuclease-5
MQLSPDQQEVFDSILGWTEGPDRETSLGGYAGTGKTTLIRELMAHPKIAAMNPIVVSLTGKACSVLSRKGVPAQTIHSTIYKAIPVGHDRFIFELLPPEDLEAGLIINDEASMTGSPLYDDLMTFGCRFLWVGDHGQLPPVVTSRSQGEPFNLMADPEHVLEKIHRQALDSPIIRLAHEIRSGKTLRKTKTDEIVVRSAADPLDLLGDDSIDQVIVAKNATRHQLNEKAREMKGLDPERPCVGDRIIFLRNNHEMGIYNGLQGTISGFKPGFGGVYEISVDGDDGQHWSDLPVWHLCFGGRITNDQDTWAPKDSIQMDYGYAITCHKAQGSEWPRIGVHAEALYGVDFQRWLYTAVTRASESLVLHLPYAR